MTKKLIAKKPAAPPKAVSSPTTSRVRPPFPKTKETTASPSKPKVSPLAAVLAAHQDEQKAQKQTAADGRGLMPKPARRSKQGAPPPTWLDAKRFAPASDAAPVKPGRKLRRDRAARGELPPSRSGDCTRLVLDIPRDLHRLAKARAAILGVTIRSYVASLVAGDTRGVR